jgi:RNA polymerase sigma-70 factor (ECF subfamily)
MNRLRAHRRDAAEETLDGLSPDRVALVHALRQIPAEQRRVIVLHHLVDLTVDQIAREVGAPTGTVKARLARGRRALAQHLNETSGLGMGGVTHNA